MSEPTISGWWEQYHRVLKASNTDPVEITKLNKLTDQLLQRGLISGTPHVPISRTGCELVALFSDKLIEASVSNYKLPYNVRYPKEKYAK